MSPEKKKKNSGPKETDFTVELEIIRDIYREYDRVVWSAPGFPAEHRPDIEAILTKTTVGDHTRRESEIQLHPDLKPEIRELSEQALTQSRVKSTVNHVAVQRLDGSQIFSPTLFNLSHAAVWETVAHQAGYAVSQVQQIIKPEDYSDEQKESVEYVLGRAFIPGREPTLGETHIEKLGFREVLGHGSYDISDIGPANFQTLNELYALTMEVVCANLMALGGDTTQFDENIRIGRFMPDAGGSKREFNKYANAVLHKIGWRELLTALKMNDLPLANSYLASLEPQYGSRVIASLAAQYEKDEQTITTQNIIEFFIVSLLGKIFR